MKKNRKGRSKRTILKIAAINLIKIVTVFFSIVGFFRSIDDIRQRRIAVEDKLARECKHAYIIGSYMAVVALLYSDTPRKSMDTTYYFERLAPWVSASVRALNLGEEFEQEMWKLMKISSVDDTRMPPQKDFLKLRDRMYQELQLRFDKPVWNACSFGTTLSVLETSLITFRGMFSTATAATVLEKKSTLKFFKNLLLQMKSSYQYITPVKGFPKKFLKDMDSCLVLLENQEYGDTAFLTTKQTVNRWSVYFRELTSPYHQK
ncbi:MAG: hypothetical protein Q7J27_09335 [Syntrophales bacterium]|nr:hypothetical protein [Syntrophales bacterium]